MKDICIFCYKTKSADENPALLPDFDSEHSTENNVVHKFVTFLERFTTHSNFDDNNDWAKGSKWLGCCNFCRVLIQTFCEDYHKMKCLEMKMEWTLKRLVGIMELASRIPARLEKLNKIFENSEISKAEHSLVRLTGYRQKVMKQCHNRLSMSQPRVVLQRQIDIPSEIHTKCQTGCLDEDVKPAVLDSVPKANTKNSDELHTNYQSDVTNITEDGLHDITTAIKSERETFRDDADGSLEELEPRSIPDLVTGDGLIDQDDELMDDNKPTSYHRLRNRKAKSTTLTRAEESNMDDYNSSIDEDDNWTADSDNYESDEMDDDKSSFVAELEPKCKRALTSGKTFQCSICAKVFPTRNKLKYHQQREHRTFRCEECGQDFKTWHLRKLHLLSDHPNITNAFKWECKPCGKSFTTKFRQSEHMKNVHKKGTPLPCKECDKICFSKLRMQMHMQNAHGKQIYHCPVCKKGFKVKSDLRKHQFIHDDPSTWKYKCEFCNRRFYHVGQWKLHKQTHNPAQTSNDNTTQGDKVDNKGKIAKTFLCTECGKICSHKGDLNKHMFTHSTGEPVVCQFCGGTYSHSYALKVHVKRHHKDATME